MKTRKVPLPYVDNAVAILLTAVINLGVVFLFNWPNGISYTGALWDSLICAAITTALDMTIVYTIMKKKRALGTLPAQVPVSPFMQRLPRNPVALGAMLFPVFAALTVGINALVLWFFGMMYMGFVPWLLYKLVYSVILSAKITETVIFRYVQPDWAGAQGDNKAQEEPVKNPLPKISVFKEMYGSVTGNLALNIIIGTALGGVVLDPSSAVVIYPITVQGIPITGLVFGLIVGILVTRGVTKAVTGAILSAPAGGTLPPPDRRFTWMPKGRFPLTCLVCLCMMLFSAPVLWLAMTLFNLPIMNFYQYTAFITIYASLISKPLSHLLVRRCTQPDYIIHVAQRGKQQPKE